MMTHAKMNVYVSIINLCVALFSSINIFINYRHIYKMEDRIAETLASITKTVKEEFKNEKEKTGEKEITQEETRPSAGK